MGRKRLWRKQSYVEAEKDKPGCIWAFLCVFRHHNVKRMIPSNTNKQKSQGKTSKHKLKPKQHQIFPPYQLEEDETKVELGISVAGLVKKSIKGRIKALLVADEDKCKDLNMLQQSQLKVVEHNCEHMHAPTLISLLKANPKPMSTPKCIEDSNPKKRVARNDTEEDQVGVLEVFRVNQDLFLKVLKDSPPRKPRLIKSRTYPSPNPNGLQTMLPSKVEHKHTEIWPVVTHGHELKKSKSQSMGRSSSLKESLDRYASLFDTNVSKDVKKGLSRSFRLTNEKEFALICYHHLRRSSKERLHFIEIESYNEAAQADLQGFNSNQTSHGELKKDCPTDFEGLDQADGLVKPCVISAQSNQQGEEMEGSFNAKDLLILTHRKCHIEDVDHNEELQYVKYVLDLMGFTAGEDPYGAWHSLNQPLDPALFDAIEVCCPFEPKHSTKDKLGITCRYYRKVIFDLINEALVYVQESSYVCYPKALSNSCHVRYLAKGKNLVLEQVWEFIGQYLKCGHDLDPIFNLAVPLGLSEDGPGWMNLQTDSEYVSLFLEDLIFDELLQEIACH